MKVSSIKDIEELRKIMIPFFKKQKYNEDNPIHEFINREHDHENEHKVNRPWRRKIRWFFDRDLCFASIKNLLIDYLENKDDGRKRHQLFRDGKTNQDGGGVHTSPLHLQTKSTTNNAGTSIGKKLRRGKKLANKKRRGL
jgi:hypothetical protein